MKKQTIKLSLIALLLISLTSCIKSTIDEIIDNTNNNTNPDYSLNFYDAEQGRLYSQNFLNIPNAAFAAGSYKIKVSSLQVSIGNKATMPTNWDNKMYCVIDFFGVNNPKDLAGIYLFPAANNKVSFKFRNDIDATNNTIERLLPDSGQIIINYDSTRKKISGELKKVLFNKSNLGTNVYDILNGTFKHISLEN